MIIKINLIKTVHTKNVYWPLLYRLMSLELFTKVNCVWCKYVILNKYQTEFNCNCLKDVNNRSALCGIKSEYKYSFIQGLTSLIWTGYIEGNFVFVFQGIQMEFFMTNWWNLDRILLRLMSYEIESTIRVQKPLRKAWIHLFYVHLLVNN